MTTVKVNLKNGAVTQHSYPAAFNSFTMFEGRPLGASPDGIFTLDGGLKDVYTTTSDERNISAWFELGPSQLGDDHVKQGRRLYLGGEFTGSMTIKVDTPKAYVPTMTYTATPRDTTLVQHTLEVPISSKQKDEYWKITVANVSGSDFSLDFIDGIFVLVNRRHGL